MPQHPVRQAKNVRGVEFAPRPLRRSRGQEWVSKTDLIRCARCPYAFWLIDTGRVKASALLDEFTAQLIAEGVQFEESVLDQVEELPEEVDFETALTQEHRLLDVPMLENDKFKIFGRPDGIDTQNGAMLPVEIKSHKDVHPYDKLELAFYWLLLEPYRTAPGLPWGILFLRRDEQIEIVGLFLYALTVFAFLRFQAYSEIAG